MRLRSSLAVLSLQALTSGAAGCLEELSFRLRESVLEAAETRWCVAHIASAPRRRNPNLLVHGGDLYLFGGYSVHERYIEDRNVLLKYDATTGRFEGVGIVQVCEKFWSVMKPCNREIGEEVVSCRAMRARFRRPGLVQPLQCMMTSSGYLAARTAIR